MIFRKNKTGEDFFPGGIGLKRNILALGLLIAAVVLVFLLGNLAYHSSEHAIEQNYQTTYRVALRNSSRVLDMNLRSIVEIVRSFLNEDPVITVLKSGNPEHSTGKFSTAEQKSLEAAAKQLAWQQAWVNDIAFFDVLFDKVFPGVFPYLFGTFACILITLHYPALSDVVILPRFTVGSIV